MVGLRSPAPDSSARGSRSTGRARPLGGHAGRLRPWARRRTGADLWFILLAEALRAAHPARADRLLERRLAVVPRAGVGERGEPIDEGWIRANLPGREDRVRSLSGPRLGISASEIRARVAAGRSIRYLVPDAVAAHIGDNGLYRSPERRTDRP
jgi:nicotinate-nucleotide adenylyltransferase